MLIRDNADKSTKYIFKGEDELFGAENVMKDDLHKTKADLPGNALP